jgi:hypothetical protein
MAHNLSYLPRDMAHVSAFGAEDIGAMEPGAVLQVDAESSHGLAVYMIYYGLALDLRESQWEQLH